MPDAETTFDYHGVGVVGDVVLEIACTFKKGRPVMVARYHIMEYLL